MGREIKRVPLDFNWPLEKIWEGFLNPFYDQQIKCPHCEGGYSPEYTALHKLWYSHLGGGFTPEMRGSVPYQPSELIVQEVIRRKLERCDSEGYAYYNSWGRLTEQQTIDREAVRMCEIWNSSWSHHLNAGDVAVLIKEGRLHDFTQRWIKPAKGRRGYWTKRRPFVMPTPRQVNDWSLQGMAHDSINCWIVLKAELKRLGQPSTCAHCKGNGHSWPSDRVRRQCAAWKRKEPPKGEGYQIWETTSEGSPISPVFATPEDLADWMCEAGHDTSITRDTSREQWLRFINGPGWAPTLISSVAGVQSGVAAMADKSL